MMLAALVTIIAVAGILLVTVIVFLCLAALVSLVCIRDDTTGA